MLECRIWDYEADDWDFVEEYTIRMINDMNVEFEQYTSKKDDKGKKVYVGDIAKNERDEIGIVVFKRGGFYLEYIKPYNWDPLEPADSVDNIKEVLGNIHENEELLNV